MSRKNRGGAPNPATALEHQEPIVVTQEPAVEVRVPEPASHWLPAGEPLPTSYAKVRRRVLPCPKCRRVFLPDGGQVAACSSSGRDVAFFRCKSCGHRWKLAVKEV